MRFICYNKENLYFKNMPKKIFIITLLFVFFLTSGFKCKNSIDSDTKEKMQSVTLTYWRVWDGEDAFAEQIAKYKSMHPFVNIQYKKLRYDEYEEALTEAFATDRGPDIFSIHNTWTQKYYNRGLISPMPANTTMVYPVLKGSIKQEVTYEKRTSKSLTTKQLKDDFVDVVYDDVVIKDQIFGLPLSVDTLAMYYNRDLFNNAGITSPSEYWDREFQQHVKKLTKQNNRGEIIQAGVALGGSDNIERSTDILSVLMMQNGTVMMTSGGQVDFTHKNTLFNNGVANPGADALRFYSDFANPAKEVYCWNSSLDNSLEAFAQNKLAMMFGYSYMLPQIKAQAPKLNFSIVKLPQIEGNSQNINFANYWIETVSKKILTDPDNLKKGSSYAKQKSDTAWDFIQFITKEKQVETYLNKTQKPTALKSLIDKQIENTDIDLFAEQLLTSKSWYKGNDSNAAEAIIKEMIDDVVGGKRSLEDAISLAVKKIQQTVK